MSYQRMINYLDLYGYKPNLFIGGFRRSGSTLGLISTISSIVICFLISIYFFLKLFDTNDLTVITSEINPEGIVSLELSKDTFYFAFALEDPITYKSFIDESIYYPKVYFKLAIRDNEEGFIWTIKELDYGHCELSDFNINYQKYFKNHNLDNLYCIKNLNETIKGVFEKSEYSFIFIELFECKNTTENNNCKNQSDIDYYLDGTFITIQYQGLTIDPNNYSNPNLPTISEYYTTISHNFFKEIHIYFKEVLVETDKGWIFPNIYTMKFSQYDHTEDMISLKTNEKGNFLEFSIKYSDKTQKYIRTYTKAQTVISNIGGFIKFIQSVFWIISYIFVQNKVYQRVINKLFYYEDKIMRPTTKLIKFKREKRNSILSLNSVSKRQRKTISIISNKKKSLFNLNSNRSFSKQSFNKSLSSFKIINQSQISYNKLNKEDLNSPFYLPHKKKNSRNINNSNFYLEENIISKKQNKEIYLNYCQRFCLKFHPNDKSYINKLYKKGIGLIEQKLDVICIIKDSFQLSLFKKMFFNNEHILIMDNIIKTELSGEKYDKNLYSLEKSDKINSEVIKAIQLIIKRYKNSIGLSYDERTELDNTDYYFIQLLNEQYNKDN